MRPCRRPVIGGPQVAQQNRSKCVRRREMSATREGTEDGGSSIEEPPFGFLVAGVQLARFDTVRGLQLTLLVSSSSETTPPGSICAQR
jgi:hypothetical protein